MIISTVKKFNINTMNTRRLNRPGFGERLSDITDVDVLKEEIADALEKKGRVYGIYKKKELVGIYIFERREDYFSESGTDIKLGDKEFDFNKFWYGTSTTALYFKRCVCLEEVENYREKIEKDLGVDLKEQIQFGRVAGVEWNDKLMYRANLKKKSRHILARLLVWYAIGFAAGWMIFDSISMASMAICFGFMYDFFLGGASVVFVEGKQIETLDFIQKREGEVDAAK